MTTSSLSPFSVSPFLSSSLCSVWGALGTLGGENDDDVWLMIFCDIPYQNVTKWCNTARNRSSVSALPFLGMASLFLSVVGVVNSSSFITDEWNSCHKNALSGIQQQLGIELDASLVEWQWERQGRKLLVWGFPFWEALIPSLLLVSRVSPSPCFSLSALHWWTLSSCHH